MQLWCKLVKYTESREDMWIFRDCYGRYIWAVQSIFGHASDNLEAELQALICAMQHAWNKGYQEGMFEGDCKKLFDFVTGNKKNFRFHNWVQDICFWSSKFKICNFTWISRNSNKDGDHLSKLNVPQACSFINNFYVPRPILTFLHEGYTVAIICNNINQVVGKKIQCFLVLLDHIIFKVKQIKHIYE